MPLWKVGLTAEEQINCATSTHCRRTLIVAGYTRTIDLVLKNVSISRITPKEKVPDDPGIYTCTLHDYYSIMLSHLFNPDKPRFAPFDNIHVVTADGLINGAESGVTIPFGDYSNKEAMQQFMVSTLTLAHQWISEQTSPDDYNAKSFLSHAKSVTGRNDHVTQGWMLAAYDAMYRAKYRIKPQVDFVISGGRIVWGFGEPKVYTVNQKQDDMLHTAVYMLYAGVAKEQGVTLQKEQATSYTAYLRVSNLDVIEMMGNPHLYVTQETASAAVQSGLRLANQTRPAPQSAEKRIELIEPATRRHMTHDITDWLKENAGRKCAFLYSTAQGRASLQSISQYGKTTSIVEYFQCLDDYDAILVIEPPAHAGEMRLLDMLSNGSVTAIYDPEHPDIGGASRSIMRKLSGKALDHYGATPTQLRNMKPKSSSVFSDTLRMMKANFEKKDCDDATWSHVVARGKQSVVHASQRDSISHIQTMISGE